MKSALKVVEVYTDGSCILHDNGRGGYGAVLRYEDTIKEIYGGYYKTTNNRMELLAVIKSLQALKERCFVTIYSDSRYVTEAINKRWVDNWTKKSFSGIKNPDLWKQLLVELRNHNVNFIWIKGHAGIAGNERADELACKGASMAELIRDVFT